MIKGDHKGLRASLLQERSTVELVFYTSVARSRSGSSSFTALVLNKPFILLLLPAGPVSYTWVARSRSESSSFITIASNESLLLLHLQ